MCAQRSNLMETLKKELAVEYMHLSAEERLQAFAEHSKWLIRLSDAGKEYYRERGVATVTSSATHQRKPV
jgi:hypothetical protein